MNKVIQLILLLLITITPVHARQAAIASAHPLASQAGEEILRDGGNAFDAAVAVAAVLAVVEPYSSGIGGGGFWLLHREQDKRAVMLDSREVAPLKARRDMYLDAQGEVIKGASINGPLSAGIPGVPAALEHLSKHYGRLSLRRNLQAAIGIAREGFAVDAHYRRMATFRLQALRSSPAAAAIFLLDNEVPPLGHRLRQPDLANTLTLLANQGADGFYRGVLANKLVDGIRQAGGIWTLADLAEYQLKQRQPLRGDYQGMSITTVAPPSSGGVALIEILNQLANYPLETLPPAQRLHLIVEAMRRAYRDRAQYLGDTDFVDVPVHRLTNKYYAAGLAASIHPRQATPSDLLPGVDQPAKAMDTTHFSIIDSQGNRVAATLSVNYPFGSCFVPPGTGVLLNDEMDDFSSKPGVPNVYGLVGAEANAIAPGKRMLSSMTPTFLETDQRIAVIGTPGGSRIITMVLLGALAFHQGADAQSIVDLPRIHHQYLPDKVFYEPAAITTQELQQLKVMGHKLQAGDNAWGNMHIAIYDKLSGKVEAAADSRGIGAAITVK